MGYTDRTWVNGSKLNKDQFRLEVKKKFFMLGGIKHWHKLPREVVDASSLETFNITLDRALGNMIYWKGSFLIEGGLNYKPLSVPFNLNHSVVSGTKFS